MASRIRSFYSVAVLYECIQSYCVNFLLSGSCVKALTVVDKMMSRSRSVVRPGISSIDRTQSVHFVRVAFRADASRDLFSSFSTAACRKSRHLHQEVSWSPIWFLIARRQCVVSHSHVSRPFSPTSRTDCFESRFGTRRVDVCCW